MRDFCLSSSAVLGSLRQGKESTYDKTSLDCKESKLILHHGILCGSSVSREKREVAIVRSTVVEDKSLRRANILEADGEHRTHSWRLDNPASRARDTCISLPCPRLPQSSFLSLFETAQPDIVALVGDSICTHFILDFSLTISIKKTLCTMALCSSCDAFDVQSFASSRNNTRGYTLKAVVTAAAKGCSFCSLLFNSLEKDICSAQASTHPIADYT